MPELPEVEVLRRDLAAEVVGRRVDAATVTGARTVRRHPPDEVVEAVAGRRIRAVGRHGKFLLVELDDGTVLVVHLRMSGQLRLEDPARPAPPHTHAVLALDDGRVLRFVDPRTFGELFVTGPDRPELAGLGVDALEPGLSPADLARQLAGRRAPVKAVLLDQRRVAGLGNIYTDEVLHEAGVHPFRPGGSLTAAEVRKVARVVPKVLRAAVEARGSSLADAQYVDLYGRTGGFQRAHRVYGREGLPCPRCGAPVQRLRLGNRSSFSCRSCQK